MNLAFGGRERVNAIIVFAHSGKARLIVDGCRWSAGATRNIDTSHGIATANVCIRWRARGGVALRDIGSDALRTGFFVRKRIFNNGMRIGTHNH